MVYQLSFLLHELTYIMTETKQNSRKKGSLSYDFGDSADVPMDHDECSSPGFIGPILHRDETVVIEKQADPTSSENHSGSMLKLLVDEYTQVRHVLEKCASRKLVSCGDGNDVCKYFDLVLVGSVNPLPRGYLCFEHWEKAQLWQEPRSYYHTSQKDNDINAIAHIPNNSQGNISSTSSLPKDVKITDTSNEDVVATFQTNMRHGYQDIFASNSDLPLNEQSALCYVKTLPIGSYLLRVRDDVQSLLQYKTEDAWEEYDSKLDQSENLVSERYSDFAIDMRWFIQHKNGPPIILNGELSGSDSSDDEYEDINASQNKIEKESEESHLRYVLVKKATRSKVCIKGFLLKQSLHDHNVWRRAWCVLIDGQLWFISRMRQRRIIGEGGIPQFSWKSRHNHIRLLRSHISDLNNNTRKNASIPYSFEVKTLEGQVHTFQAGSRQEQLKWIQAIANEIVTSHESNHIEMAELIIGDEQEARTRRFEDSVNDFLKVTQIPRHRGSNLWSMTGAGGEIVDLTRFTMLINEFKEVRRNYSHLPGITGSRNWSLNRISIARQLDAAGAVCASPFFKERTFDDDEFKMKRREIVHMVVEKQKKLNQTDENVDPPPSDIFDEILSKLTYFAANAEKTHKENGLFGY